MVQSSVLLSIARPSFQQPILDSSRPATHSPYIALPHTIFRHILAAHSDFLPLKLLTNPPRSSNFLVIYQSQSTSTDILLLSRTHPSDLLGRAASTVVLRRSIFVTCIPFPTPVRRPIPLLAHPAPSAYAILHTLAHYTADYHPRLRPSCYACRKGGYSV